jgi:hypothetical protein
VFFPLWCPSFGCDLYVAVQESQARAKRDALIHTLLTFFTMKPYHSLFLLIAPYIVCSCVATRPPKIPETLGRFQSELSYGYHPVDPLPVKVKVDTGKINNLRKMNGLPDETMRLAIGQIQANGGISFGPAKAGVAGERYVVVLDYVKSATLSFPVDTSTSPITNQKVAIYDRQQTSAFKPRAIGQC